MNDYDYEMAQAAHDMQARLETDIGTLVDERDEARAQLANAAASEVDAVQGCQECEAELREARERIEALEELVGRIPNVVSYVTATLAPATDDPGAEWGKVHRGRAGLSINQLKELARRAYWLLEEDADG